MRSRLTNIQEKSNYMIDRPMHHSIGSNVAIFQRISDHGVIISVDIAVIFQVPARHQHHYLDFSSPIQQKD